MGAAPPDAPADIEPADGGEGGGDGGADGLPVGEGVVVEAEVEVEGEGLDAVAVGGRGDEAVDFGDGLEFEVVHVVVQHARFVVDGAAGE